MIKRVFDIIASSAGLICLCPILIVIAFLIKSENSGPVLYRGVRVGRFGRPFSIFKFRTMVVDADKIGGSSTSDNDPRITKVGNVLRKFKLDELPQLMNVLLGEMSFVGPRPEVQYYVDMYTDEEKIISSVRPGITDWASLWNSDEGALLSESNDPDKTYLEEIRPTKLKLQLKYVKEQNFWTDVKIIFSTLKAIATK